MNKPIRIIISCILVASSIAAAIFGVALALQISSWEMIVGVVSILCTSVLLLASGAQIASGARIRDVLSELFRALGR